MHNRPSLGTSPSQFRTSAQSSTESSPTTSHDRHLEVLAAFATAITRDVNIREQLYHARSPAHAYDILHHDDAEDINYFLEEAIEHFTGNKE
jgi:hypothetical protein